MLGFVADRVCSVDRRRVLVGIDGRSGSGKSTFADELAAHLGQRGRVVIRSTTDSFHRPREERLARGTTSADGYYLDSHDLDRIANELLIPFRQGADHVLVAAFNEPTDTANEEIVDVTTDAVLVFDGLFLHRAGVRSDMGRLRLSRRRRTTGHRMAAVPADGPPRRRVADAPSSSIADSTPPGGRATDTVGTSTSTTSHHAAKRQSSSTTTTSHIRGFSKRPDGDASTARNTRRGETIEFVEMNDFDYRTTRAH